MNEIESELLREASDGAKPRLVMRTDTRIDTGRWWRPTPIWLCIMDDEVLILAASRRRFVESAPIEECAESYYCHASGALVLHPVEGLRFPQFKMPPREALRVLHELFGETSEIPSLMT